MLPIEIETDALFVKVTAFAPPMPPTGTLAQDRLVGLTEAAFSVCGARASHKIDPTANNREFRSLAALFAAFAREMEREIRRFKGGSLVCKNEREHITADLECGDVTPDTSACLAWADSDRCSK
jgi:hypothetical protein